jgi:acyl carrier protein
MTREEVKKGVQEIFRDVFDDENLKITDKTTAEDVEDWDSMAHIVLLGAIEDAFHIKFPVKEIANIKTVGQIIDLTLKLGGAYL